jgi:Holliday junction DNA helicase RuvA
MIGRLRGILAEVGEDEALLDVGGVGYVVRCGARTLSRLPEPGQEVVLHVETQWSQDQGPRLYGFVARDDRRAFLALQSVQGVGPKAALGVLDVLSVAELAQAVAREDKAAVGRAQGVGPKLAQRIVAELKDKPLAEVGAFAPRGGPAPAASAPPAPSVSGEAVSALMGLGIGEPQARRAVEHAQSHLGDDAELPAVIRAALKEIGR